MIITTILQNLDSKKWAYCEYSDENIESTFRIIEGKEFDSYDDARSFSKEYENKNPQITENDTI